MITLQRVSSTGASIVVLPHRLHHQVNLSLASHLPRPAIKEFGKYLEEERGIMEKLWIADLGVRSPCGLSGLRCCMRTRRRLAV